ncbi:MAG: phosphoadenosine phosphosulfate reductase family protein, partial [Armatimonadia bacterium]
TQRYQWCSFRLKIEPGMKWLEEHDPHKSAVCLVGARRDEAKSPADSRAQFPEYLVRSDNHGGRLMLAPMVHWTSDDRDALLRRAGIEPLPHRSRECKCINSNREDMRLWTEDDIDVMRSLEREIDKPIFRAARHMGAKGIDEVVRWARSERGQYAPAEEDPIAEEDIMGCPTGWCER